jgi:hypothetical protein
MLDDVSAIGDNACINAVIAYVMMHARAVETSPRKVRGCVRDC